MLDAFFLFQSFGHYFFHSISFGRFLIGWRLPSLCCSFCLTFLFFSYTLDYYDFLISFPPSFATLSLLSFIEHSLIKLRMPGCSAESSKNVQRMTRDESATKNNGRNLEHTYLQSPQKHVSVSFAVSFSFGSFWPQRLMNVPGSTVEPKQRIGISRPGL